VIAYCRLISDALREQADAMAADPEWGAEVCRIYNSEALDFALRDVGIGCILDGHEATVDGLGNQWAELTVRAGRGTHRPTEAFSDDGVAADRCFPSLGGTPA
jgi:hypothetical protein